MFLIRRADIKFRSSKEDVNQDYYVVFNFFRSLRALIEQLKPDKVFFCCESFSSFRKELFSEYKANRIVKRATKTKKSEDAFYRQANEIIELLKHLPITQVRAEGYEADDVIATLAVGLNNENVIVVSADKDFQQLLQRDCNNIRVFNPKDNIFVKAPPYHMATFLATNGDTADNIPRLVPKKRALELSTSPKKLAEWLSHEENRANFRLNRQLVDLQIIDEERLEFVDYETNFAALRREFVDRDLPSIFEGGYWVRFKQTFERLR